MSDRSHIRSDANPLISVGIPAYNAEKYIGDAIQSVLRQSFDDWELVIVNDGSTDGTLKRVRDFDDPRITCISQENQGPAAGYNRAIAASRGKYFAILNADDICYPDRLERQLREYETGGRRVLFGEADFINSEGRPFEGSHFLSGRFEKKQLTRPQILERFFTRGNFLCAPTVFSERDVFLEAGRFDPSIFHAQDFEMWIRLVKNYELCLLPGPVTQYRIHDDNLTGPAADGPARGVGMNNEVYLLMRRFFDDVSPKLFHEAFDQLLIRPACKSDLERMCEQAFLYLKSPNKLKKLIGVEKLGQLLRDPESEIILTHCYDFTSLSFANILKSIDFTN